MSISTIAAQLYTIQSKKNVPLKTAFAMLVREDLAMRFSVYNLAKIITKSEFIASVAQTAFGQRTPLQKKQDEMESKKEAQDKKFKQFTAGSIANLNRKVNLLTNITERNSILIAGLYSELGTSRAQRRMDPKLFAGKAVRVPVLSKTIKGKLDQLTKEIDSLKKMPKVGRAKVSGKVAKKKTKKEESEDQFGFITKILPLLLRNPRLLMLMGGGTGAAIGVGSIALQAYSMYNFSGALGRIGGRLSGEPGFADPLTERVSQMADTAITGVGAYTLGRLVTAGASAIRRRGIAGTPMGSTREGRLALINKFTKEYRARGMDFRSAQAKAGKKASQFIRYSDQAKKFNVLRGVFGQISKRVPALAAADVAITISQMSGYVADHTTGRMSQQKFKENMVSGYADLISTVGIGGASTILGGLAGSALFPGVGTFAGAAVGGVFGYLASIFFEESASVQALANRMFEMIHENKTVKLKPVMAEVPEPQTPQRQGVNQLPPDVSTQKPKISDALNDQEFIGEVYRVAEKYELNPLDLLEVMFLESRLDPAAKNPKGSATGLIQFTESTAQGLGTNTAALRMMTRAGQMKYVDKYFESVNLPKGASREQIYAHVFLPAMAQQGVSIFADKNDPNTARYYELNRGLDTVEPFGKITIEDFRANTNRLRNLIPVSTARMIEESKPLINITPNVRAMPPPKEEPKPATGGSTTDATQANVNATAASMVAVAANQKIDLTQQQINNHDGRINILETNQKSRLSRNDGFEEQYA